VTFAALAAVRIISVPVASADPGQNCKTEWNLIYNVPIGGRTTCFNPDGNYHMCTSLGMDGRGPGRAGTIRLPLGWWDSPHSAPRAGNAASTAASTITVK